MQCFCGIYIHPFCFSLVDPIEDFFWPGDCRGCADGLIIDIHSIPFFQLLVREIAFYMEINCFHTPKVSVLRKFQQHIQ